MSIKSELLLNGKDLNDFNYLAFCHKNSVFLAIFDLGNNKYKYLFYDGEFKNKQELITSGQVSDMYLNTFNNTYNSATSVEVTDQSSGVNGVMKMRHGKQIYPPLPEPTLDKKSPKPISNDDIDNLQKFVDMLMNKYDNTTSTEE